MTLVLVMTTKDILMRSKKEYYEDGRTIKSITYYLGGKEFDQIFFDEKGNFESHIMLYDYNIRESHTPLF